MLLGPSPGSADKSESIRMGGPNRPVDSVVTIGRAAGRIYFDSNKGRNGRWDNLRKAGFGKMADATDAADIADALTTLANLDWGNHGDHHAIPDAYLSMGCADVFEVMKQAKPRVVITLVRRTWDALLPFLEEQRGIVAGYVSATGLDCRMLCLPENEACTLLLRSPQHPSRHFFTATHAELIRQEVDYFLNRSSCPMNSENR